MITRSEKYVVARSNSWAINRQMLADITEYLFIAAFIGEKDVAFYESPDVC